MLGVIASRRARAEAKFPSTLGAAGVLCSVLLACLLAARAPHAAEPDATPRVRELPFARQAIDATGFAGTILIYDTRANESMAGHVERIDRQLIPASTFKILNSLIALETGVVADANTVLKWDGVVRERTELNRDLDLATAFRLSAVPQFQELARRIGLERMQRYVDAVGYGNRDLSGGVDRFWLSGGLRISPREQVELLARLYRGDLPFSERSMATVKAIMALEPPATPLIRAKTGWAVLPERANVGWWVGWVDGPDGAHVFATALEAESPGPAFLPARQAVTREVLTQLGVLGAAR